MKVTHSVINQLKKIVPSGIKRFLLRHSLVRAEHYVGTDKVSGQLQFELLKKEGCGPDSKVLEVGCGCLHAGIPLIPFLKKGAYVGIEPNKWLLEKSLENPHVRQIVEEKQARFLNVDDFNATELGIKFDFVLSHSVLSHCAHWQFEQFLQNIGKVLAPRGRILASIRLAEGNPYGSSGAPDKEDSMHEEWQYPEVSWFKLSTITKKAEILGLTAVHIPEYTEFYTKTRPAEYHDWFVFSWKSAKE